MPVLVSANYSLCDWLIWRQIGEAHSLNKAKSKHKKWTGSLSFSFKELLVNDINDDNRVGVSTTIHVSISIMLYSGKSW